MVMVKLELDERIVTLINDHVASGDFADASAVVGEGLRLLQLRDRRTHLDHLLEEARAEYDRGEYQVWSPTMLEDIVRQVKENERLGVAIDLDPDVV